MMETYQAPTVAELTHAYGLDARFYALWLDPYLAYSCGNWDTADNLAEAQLAKLDCALDSLELPKGGKFLDVGCGWGSLLRRGAERGLHGTGLVPVAEQAAYCRALGFEVQARTWQTAQVGVYDAMASIGSFEHFAARRASQPERVAQYRLFFDWAADHLCDGGRLYLQTICFLAGSILDPNRLSRDAWRTIVRRMHPIRQEWPNSMLPTSLSEILDAADPRFEVLWVRARRHDYARTCAAWLEALRARREEALARASEKTVLRFERYLSAAGPAFDQGLTNLYQIVLSKREPIVELTPP